jgi:hypothetical protein
LSIGPCDYDLASCAVDFGGGREQKGQMDVPRIAVTDTQKKDSEQITLLVVFHFLFAVICMAGIGFLFLHYSIFHKFFANPDMWKGQKNAPPKEFFEFFKYFVWFYVVMGAFLVIDLLLNVVSAFCLMSRKGRMFSLVVAGLNCVQIPFGTALGVFTIVVLMRDSVRRLYQ